MLQLSAVDKQYAAKRLFAELNWQIEPGQRVGLVGANGAGKTTLLRILAGEEVPDAGQISRGNGETLAYLPQEAPRVNGGSVRARVEGGAEQVQRLGRELDALQAEMAATRDADAAQALAARYDDAQQAFALADGYTLTARAEAILLGLGFAADALDRPLQALSGGWWMRAELARLLVARPDYLLMDEPTNHLDGESLAWLETFLAGYPGSWVVISHDRTFLNRCAERIAELAHGQLRTYPGNYDAFVAAKELAAQQAEAEAQAHARQHAHLTAFVDRFGAKASKARQAQSRRKQLEKLAPPPPPAARQKRMHMRLQPPPRSGQAVVQLADAQVVRGQRVVLQGVDLLVERGQKVAIVGPNGAGKSTLLKLLAGELAPTRGTRTLGHNVLPYAFAQHQLDMLNGAASVYDEVAGAMPQASIGEIRGLLGAFLFGNDAIDRRVAALSGGEKARLALAKMLAQPTNLLLLDEPTNHLDLASREVLEAALRAFAGTVIFVSHDRYFVDQLASHVLHLPGDGQLHRFDGPYAAFVAEECRRQAEAAHVDAPPPARRAAAGAPAPAPPGNGKASYLAGKAARKDAAKRQRAIADIEADIAAKETELAALDGQLAEPAIFADASRATALLQARTTLAETTLPALMAHWEALSLADEG